MSNDEMKQREKELMQEMKLLLQRMRRVTRELGDLQLGCEPPARENDNWVPPFLRKGYPT